MRYLITTRIKAFMAIWAMLQFATCHLFAVPALEEYGKYVISITPSLSYNSTKYYLDNTPYISYTVSDGRFNGDSKTVSFDKNTGKYQSTKIELLNQYVSNTVSINIQSGVFTFFPYGTYGSVCTSCHNLSDYPNKMAALNNDFKLHTIDYDGKIRQQAEYVCHQCMGVGEGLYFNIDYKISSNILCLPKTVDLFLYDTNDKLAQESLLPSDDAMTVLFTKGFLSKVYNPRYTILGEGEYIPISEDNSTISKGSEHPYIKMTGKELLGVTRDEYKELIADGRKIVIDNDFTTDSSKKTLTLTPVLSAPAINIDYEMPKCYGDSGVVTVSLSEFLETNFNLPLVVHRKGYLQGELPYTQERMVLTASITTSVFKVAGGDSIIVEMSGEWADGNGKSHFYYCDAPRHKAVLTMPKAPEPLVVEKGNIDNVKCHGGRDGKVYFNMVGGTGTKTATIYVADAPVAVGTSVDGHSFDKLAAGKYYVLAKDQNGCKSNQYDVIVAEPEALTFGVSHEDATVFDKADGRINITEIHGGTLPYTVRWANTATAETGSYQINNPAENVVCVSSSVKAGTYSVLISDRNNCTTDSKPVTILQPDKLVIESIEETKHILCSGDRGFDGAEVAAAVTGGVGSYTYTWKGDDGQGDGTSATGHTRAQLAAGRYTLYVRDRNGAIAQRNFTVQEPAPLKTDIQTTDIKCMGSKNGALHASVSGGTAPYTCNWTDSDGKPISSVSAINNLAEGSYTLSVTDANGCKANTTAKINVLSDITVEETLKRDVSCYGLSDGEVSYMISGGVAPYTVNWLDETLQTDGTVERTNIKAGVYSITVSDKVGCSRQLSVSINQPDKIEIGIPDKIKLCKDQRRLLSAGSPDTQLTFRWYKDGSPFSSEPAAEVEKQGVYKIVASDDNCSETVNVTVTESDDLISSDWIVASKAPAGSAVRLVNITRENAESCDWIYDENDGVEMRQEGDRFIELVFPSAGKYMVGMHTANKGCETISMKEIEVVEEGEDIGDYKDQQPLITRFSVSPNPSDGNITIDLNLSQTADAAIGVYDIVSGRQVLDTIRLTGNKSYRKSENLTLPSGIYYMVLTFADNRLRETFKLIIK